MISRLTRVGAMWFPHPQWLSDLHLGSLGIAAENLFSGPSIPVLSLMDAMPIGSRTLTMLQFACAQTWLATNGPLYTIDAAMAEQLVRTDVLSSVRGNDIRRKNHAMWFMVPESVAFRDTETGGRITSIVVAHVEVRDGKGDYVFKSSGVQIPVDVIGTDVPRLFAYASYDNGEVSCVHVPLFPERTINESLDMADRVITDELYCTDADPVEVRNATRWIIQFVVNAMLILQAYPQYVASSKVAKRNCFKTCSTVPIMAHMAKPLARVEVPETPGNAPSSERGTKQRQHWRGGHWRRQPHSTNFVVTESMTVGTFPDGRTYHMVWIEPYMIGRVTNG